MQPPPAPGMSLDTVIAALRTASGPRGVITDPVEMAPYLLDQRGLHRGRAPLVARPATVSEVAAVVKVCREAGYGIVPQGGNTGLVRGSVPDTSGTQIVLSLERLDRVRSLDPLNFTLVAEAGCILADVQARAEAAGLLFPLSLAAEGSCRIGGNLATNAGGTGVLRYGNARDLVLGLEVVLASGAVWNGLRTLRKDNTGYDLKQLFLGSEGTLGIITAAALKLFPRPREQCTAFAAIASAEAATELLGLLRAEHGDAVTAYEYIERTCLDMVLARIPGTRDPLASRYQHYLLIELSAVGRDPDLRERLEETLAVSLDQGLVLDATLAASRSQSEALWRLRESIPEASKLAGAGIKHDIAVALTDVPRFLARATQAVRDALPTAKIVAFGHLGDGNLHFNLNQPDDMDGGEFLAHGPRMNELVHDIAVELGGSFSAEHGIGRLKREALGKYKSSLELELMRTLKRALDPDGLLNPGAVV